ncbi:TetR/AcrR family transcriptional regulator [Sphingobium sp. AP50]|uniref:TetR/AcrR family transcriptional regulator n=1 Tax=Sphingobium sp. AP50 TaxID=1884369 RepID=UPI0015A5A9EA|nr:TetR/AcrR family transcriptional regulator [Sphingobium sp. AP50]
MEERSLGLTDGDWIDAARDLLIREGIGTVRIDRIAKECGVSRGGFYWRFKNRDALLICLLDDWVAVNRAIIDRAVVHPAMQKKSAKDAILDLIALWNQQSGQSEYDLAVRGWAKTSSSALKATQAIDADYIGGLVAQFHRHGFERADAEFRAFILYNHHLGLCTSLSFESPINDSSKDLALFLLRL